MPQDTMRPLGVRARQRVCSSFNAGAALPCLPRLKAMFTSGDEFVERVGYTLSLFRKQFNGFAAVAARHVYQDDGASTSRRAPRRVSTTCASSTMGAASAVKSRWRTGCTDGMASRERRRAQLRRLRYPNRQRRGLRVHTHEAGSVLVLGGLVLSLIGISAIPATADEPQLRNPRRHLPGRQAQPMRQA